MYILSWTQIGFHTDMRRGFKLSVVLISLLQGNRIQQIDLKVSHQIIRSELLGSQKGGGGGNGVNKERIRWAFSAPLQHSGFSVSKAEPEPFIFIFKQTNNKNKSIRNLETQPKCFQEPLCPVSYT